MTLDNGQPLAAVGTESTSFYLYGRGVIGTKTDTWGYILQDGLGSTRQLATHEGVIAMSVAYTPWGDVLEYYGSGGIDFGYLGGMYDEDTGLIYLGNGQYYDPVTGRMLTRGAGANPYKPGAFDPTGIMIAPLAILGLTLGKKKKRGKWDTFIALLVVCVVMGMSVSACTQQTKESSSGSPAPTPTRTFTSAEIATIDAILAGKTEIAVIVTPAASPTVVITSTATLEPGCGGMELPTPSIDNAQMLLNAIRKQESDLPKGFSVALFLAMAKRESGGAVPEYRNYNEGDPNYVGGALQLRGKYLHEKNYTPDQAGYDANVGDAIIAINEKYTHAIHEAENNWLDYGFIN